MSEEEKPECCSCGATDVELFKFTNHSNGQEHEHCRICYSTLIGNACVYPGMHDGGQMARGLAGGLNFILKEIRAHCIVCGDCNQKKERDHGTVRENT